MAASTAMFSAPGRGFEKMIRQSVAGKDSVDFSIVRIIAHQKKSSIEVCCPTK
jgi:hypothetical protein